MDMTHYPTIFDIISLKRLLSHALPNELIDIILDLAEYWPHFSRSSPSPIKAQGEMRVPVPPDVHADWLDHRGPEAIAPISFTDSSEDGFVLRSPPLGISSTDGVQSQLSLVPRTRHPVRMIIFEIRYSRLFAINPKCRRRQVVCQSSTRLEVGIKKPESSTDPSRKAVLDPHTLSTASTSEDSRQFPQYRDHIYERWHYKRDRVYQAWHFKRSFCDPAHAKIDLYMDHKVLKDGMIGQKTVLWRYDDDEVASAKLDDGWDLSEEALGRLSEAEKAHLAGFVHSLAKEDRMEQADFMKQLEVGDSLGVWVRVKDGPSVSMIEEMRVHVFWAAS